MDGDGDGNNHHASSSSSTTFLQQLVAQRTAFVQVKQGELTDDDLATAQPNDHTNTDINNDDPDGHLCVVCMDNERSCLCVCRPMLLCAWGWKKRGGSFSKPSRETHFLVGVSSWFYC